MFGVVVCVFLILKGPTEAKGPRANESHNAAMLVGLVQRLTQSFSGRIFFNFHFTDKETEASAS